MVMEAHDSNQPPSLARLGRVCVADARARVSQMLAAAGCLCPDDDAAALVACALGCRVDELDARATVLIPVGMLERLDGWVRRRAQREPVEYIVGTCRFRGLTLMIDRRAHVPHPRSEPLVMIVGALCGSHARVHDVGCGAGPIALALKAEHPQLTVSGSDISADALELARENAKQLHLAVDFYVAGGVPGGKEFDVVCGALPYGAIRDAETAPPEHGYQPSVSCYAGTNGLEVIEEVCQGVAPGTTVALQHAVEQTAIVRSLLAEPRTVPSAAGAAFTIARGRERNRNTGRPAE